MKQIFTLGFFLFALAIHAQPPQRMSYQAVIRNASNVLVANTPIGMRVSILQGNAAGTEVYKEVFNPNPVTNGNGLVSVEIGGGTPVTGTFAGINWASGPFFVKIETDPGGGTNYTITATSQLLSVPYALNASCIASFLSGDTLKLGCKDYIIPGIKEAPSTSINNGLVAHYPFNGNANDESGNGNNGTVTGAVLTTDRFGRTNKAYNFNGTNNYITTISGGPLGISARSFSLWVRTSSTQMQYILSYGNCNGNGGCIAIALNNPCSGAGIDVSNAALMRGNNSILNNQWQHIVLVIDPSLGNTISNVKVYINGINQTNITCSALNSSAVINTLNLLPYTFGKDFSNGRLLKGDLDDVRIYNRVITQEEITYLYNN